MIRYGFSDESGNFDFTTGPSASKYFAVGTLLVDSEDERRSLVADMDALKYELLLHDAPVDGCFHASEDRQAVRDRVFEVLLDHNFVVDTTLLDKRKAHPKVRSDDAMFYRYAWYFHFNRIGWRLCDGDRLQLVTASLGTKKKRGVFHRQVQEVVAQKCKVRHMESCWRDETDYCLQAVDYCLWAVTRYFERDDRRSLDIIEPKIGSMFQPFSSGNTLYY